MNLSVSTFLLKITRLTFIITLSCLSVKQSSAQASSDFFHNDSLAGFDEQTILKEMIDAGVPSPDLPGYLQFKKDEYINQKYGSVWGQPISDPLNPPSFDGNQVKDGKKGKGGYPTPQGVCNNVDFETGNFAGWLGKYGRFNTCATACPSTGFVFGRHTIMTGAGFDPIVGPPLKMVASGGAFSLRLGNSSTGAEAESIEQTFTVQPNATSFTYRYAVVLQNPPHTIIEQPSFKIEVFNSVGSLIPCAQYYVAASEGIDGFQSLIYKGEKLIWKDWTTVNVDLSSYIGQNVTVRFTTRDCKQQGHFGYAYLDGDCLGIQISQGDTLCEGGTAALTAPAGSASYTWFPGGETTQSINVNTPGTYTVNLTSFQGCQTSALYTINQYPRPVASFTPVQGTCSSTIQFNDGTTITSGSVADWKWSFGSSGNDSIHQQSPSFTYPTPGTYTVNLIATSISGCKDTASAEVLIPTSPVVNFNNTTACLGSPTQFTDLSTVNPGLITQWTWDFGEPSSGSSNTDTQTNPNHTYSAAGTYLVKLIVATDMGCVDSILLPIMVNAIPIPNFAGTKVCEGNVTKFTDISYVNPGGVTGWDWDFGDGNTSTLRNPSHVYANAGVYSVSLTALSNGGCPAIVVKDVTVDPLPSVQFTASDVCLNAPAQFKDISAIPFGSSLSGWSWNFGDPGSATNTSNQQHPQHTFTTTGVYTVSLTATTNKGCTGALTQTLTVYPSADPDFAVPGICIGGNSVFTDQSTASSGAITMWEWNFGESQSGADNTSNSPNPSHSYTSCGTFNASLIITNSYDCKSLIIKPVTVSCQPNASFAAANACENAQVQFNNTSSITTGSISSYSWDFGDPASGGNNTDIQTNPIHQFSGTGVYTVSLTAISDGGCQHTQVQDITLYPRPEASFTADPVCEGVMMAFTDQSSVTSGSISAYFWDFADPSSGINNSSTLQNPTHQHSAYGVYTTTLIVYSGVGCSDTVAADVTVYPVPKVDFVADSVCEGIITSFTNLSTISNATITGYTWDFGDPGSGGANTDTQTNSSHSYLTGTYTTSLIATSSDGCISSVSKPVLVHPLPVPGFNASSVCLGSLTQFTSTSTVISGSISNYEWNFGDGALSSQANPTNLYGSGGTYVVTLTVTTDQGCTDSIQQPIEVFFPPEVGFVVDDSAGCLNHCVQFSDTSKINNGSLAAWHWEFGDGNTSVQQHPSHCYTSPGIFTVTLTVTSNNNCQSLFTHPNMIEVFPQPLAEFTAQPQPTTILNPLIKFSDKSIGAQNWSWYFGENDSLLTGNANPSYEYNDTGRYVVTLVVENQYGCMDTVVHDVYIGPDFLFYIPNAFTPNEDDRNEHFFPLISGVTEYDFWIYDRWGNLIWHTSDPKGKWNGKANGGTKIAQQDVYVWKIGNGAKNSWCFSDKYFLNCTRMSEEYTSSAGEQLVSNRAYQLG